MLTTRLRSVPFFRYPHVFTSREDEILTLVRDVGRRGAFILQEDLVAFEKNLARFLGAKYAVGVGNATDGLHFALRAAGIGPGDEVIISSHTMVATAGAVHFAGANCIPVDCGPDHLIDPEAVQSAITSTTKAIMPTQLNGRTADMDSLQKIADAHGLMILEDAAQALGSKFKGRSASTFGVAGAISFYPAKVLGCFGDGGAVIVQDDAVYERIVQLRDHGRSSSGEILSWGLNSRLDNLQAALLDLQFRDYDSVIARRRHLAGLYHECLSDVPELALPPAPASDPDHFDIFQNYEIEATRRDELKAYLKEHGVGTLIQWGGVAIHQLKHLGITQDLPRTDELFTRLLMLPMNMSLQDEEVVYVSNVVRAFYGRAPRNS
ncbi:MAG: DegT/DnrJ/EryC1/StrS family aminotransferase [Bryobacterales bacterium]|nr:DegT/DnrJ/EryC1/StrS family aminotransferase [Bryobacterales bacterium]